MAEAGAEVRLARSIAGSNQWSIGFRDAIPDAIRSGGVLRSSNTTVFSQVAFVMKSGDVEALRPSIAWLGVNLNKQDKHGVSPARIAAKKGNIEAFHAGVNKTLTNNAGKTALSLAQ
ncbi:hypothetical protein QJS10_CPA08g01508 [Acorus calamus]|uniref:Ankyrin repeat domain-containing protein n=1 Tax=Acorus calamus TaxID=4465 RepID=A0AAV9EDJ8_ACOCL|nr:hypothetical protein QJS10_CPA08g01508 [Acorus calamus]